MIGGPQISKRSVEYVLKNKELVGKSRATKEETFVCHAIESAKSLIL